MKHIVILVVLTLIVFFSLLFSNHIFQEPLDNYNKPICTTSLTATHDLGDGGCSKVLKYEI